MMDGDAAESETAGNEAEKEAPACIKTEGRWVRAQLWYVAG